MRFWRIKGDRQTGMWKYVEHYYDKITIIFVLVVFLGLTHILYSCSLSSYGPVWCVVTARVMACPRMFSDQAMMWTSNPLSQAKLYLSLISFKIERPKWIKQKYKWPLETLQILCTFLETVPQFLLFKYFVHSVYTDTVICLFLIKKKYLFCFRIREDWAQNTEE